MSVNPVSGSNGLFSSTAVSNTSTTAASTTGALGAQSSQLGESAFLTLLSAELQYQDPLQPMDNTQFVAELAQFSQLSATTSQTNTLHEILSAVQSNSTSLVDASQLIGKVVTTQSGASGEVTAVSSSSSGLSFEVSGVGVVQPSDITQISLSTTGAASGSSTSMSSGSSSTAP
jgi:flagellar basal-body rod modification protein FlgD